jgi:hypothetical protein
MEMYTFKGDSPFEVLKGKPLPTRRKAEEVYKLFTFFIRRKFFFLF